jgi:flagellar secretion chaperone FliS
MSTSTTAGDAMARQQQAARARYMKDTVQTLSPARLVTMLYDALVSDFERAEAAILASDSYAANGLLVKAQAILIELRSSLKPELWSAGPRLAALYDYLIREVVQANVAKDAARVATCRRLVEPLRDAWHVAAREVQGQPAP